MSGRLGICMRAGLLALQLLLEGSSIRSVERITELHRDTILRLLVLASITRKPAVIVMRLLLTLRLQGYDGLGPGGKIPWFGGSVRIGRLGGSRRRIKFFGLSRVFSINALLGHYLWSLG